MIELLDSHRFLLPRPGAAYNRNPSRLHSIIYLQVD